MSMNTKHWLITKAQHAYVALYRAARVSIPSGACTSCGHSKPGSLPFAGMASQSKEVSRLADDCQPVDAAQPDRDNEDMSSARANLGRMARLQTGAVSLGASMLLGLTLHHARASGATGYNGQGLRGDLQAIGGDFQTSIAKHRKGRAKLLLRD